jgi:rod shape-determining protein MreC
MIADHRFHALERVRLSLSVLAHPCSSWLAARAGARPRRRLLREPGPPAAREPGAQGQGARAIGRRAGGALLRAEQEQLLAMAPGKSRYADGHLAEVLYTARNPFTRKIVVDKGLTHGVAPGMPVIDGSGVVGQVTNVGTFTSEVTLVTEKDQSVPVMLVRNGLRASRSARARTARSTCPFMPVSADIQNGDVFVTSGIDAHLSAGLLVAQVTSVEKNAALVFAKIVARPAAGVENHRYVMVLPLPAPRPPRPEARPRSASRARRGKRRAASAKPPMRPADLTPVARDVMKLPASVG